MKRNKRQIAALFLVAMCGFTPAITAADNLASVKGAIIEKWDQLDSMTGVFSVTGEIPSFSGHPDPEPLNGVGTISYLKQYEKVFSYWKLSFTPSPKDPRRVSALYIINDKDEYKEIVFLDRILSTGKLEGGEKAFAAGGKALFDFLEYKFDLTVLPEDMIDNKPVYVIQGKLKDPESLPSADRFLFFFSQETGVLMKTVGYVKGIEEPAITLTTGNIKFNEPLTEDLFTYVPPAPPAPEKPKEQAAPDTKDTQQTAPAPALAPAPETKPTAKPAPTTPQTPEQAPKKEAVEKKAPAPAAPETASPADPFDPGPGVKPAPDPDKKDALAPTKDKTATPSKE